MKSDLRTWLGHTHKKHFFSDFKQMFDQDSSIGSGDYKEYF